MSISSPESGLPIKKIGPDSTRQILRVLYRGPIYDNGTSNAFKSPLTTELRTLGLISGIRRQNSIRIRLQLKKQFFGRFWISPYLYLIESRPNFLSGVPMLILFTIKKNQVCTFVFTEIMNKKLILVDLVDTLPILAHIYRQI